MFNRVSRKYLTVIILLEVYLINVGLRLIPRLSLDPHLLTFNADIWYRLCLAQNLLDQGHLPQWDIRYLAYGQVPLWYNPLALYIFAFLSKLFQADLPTISSRIMPFVESLSALPVYFLCKGIYNRRVAIIAAFFLTLTPCYIYWAGISTLQSFTLFLIPVNILLWIRFTQKRYLLNTKWRHLAVMGILLTFNFLIHLSYFSHVIILLAVQLGLIIEKKSKYRHYLYLGCPIILSQVLTLWWWLPNNLYWWWSKGLSTSSGYADGFEYLKNYGISTGILGHLALGLVACRFLFGKNKPGHSYYTVPLLWAVFPLLESHNDWLIALAKSPKVTWNNLAKPLEGFRFYVFLAQPLAVCVAVILGRTMNIFHNRSSDLRKILTMTGIFILCATLSYDMISIYKIGGRFNNSGLQMRDIHAAQWFRKNSKPTDRILGEYYTSQMFAGICGGKALLGFMFPLRGVNIPYISNGSTVMHDVYSVYTSSNIDAVTNVLNKYGCTHVYYSNHLIIYVETFLRTNLDKTLLTKTLFNKDYFRVVFKEADVVILERINRSSR